MSYFYKTLIYLFIWFLYVNKGEVQSNGNLTTLLLLAKKTNKGYSKESYIYTINRSRNKVKR